jgi:antitoxin ChpS
VYTTKLRKVGGSVMLAIPPRFLDVLRLHAGEAVALSVDGGHLIVEPQIRSRYTLDELLAQCDASAEASVEDQKWLDSKPIGGELL